MSRLQLLTTKFENLRMKDDECIHDFHMNILDIFNLSSALGEKMLEEKLVKKILRYLPKKFDMNVTTIEEAQDICNMKVEELIGSLQTFELAISDRSESKNKSISFISNTDDDEVQCDMEVYEGISNAIVLLGRKFNKVLKGMDRKPRPNVKNILECSTYLKKQKKGLSISWSDDDSKGEPDDETAKHVTTFSGRYESDEGEKKKRIIAQLQAEKEKLLSTVTVLENEVTLLNSKLENMTKSVRRLNNGSIMLDEILQVGKGSRDLKGKGGIKGIGKLMCTGLPRLVDVLLVKGLTANLISINQLCDQGLKVNYIKSECLVTNKKSEVLMRGVRSKDNCYLRVPQQTTYSSICLMSREDEVKLWHEKLGHLNLKGTKKIMFEETIRGLPKLKIEEGKVCGIGHEFSSPITPQQNGVVECKNRTLKELARVMLHAKNLPYHFWAEPMKIACYIHNRVTLRVGTSSTLYELWKGRKPNVKYFHVFGSKCYILADRE
ncbi:uncharacterized protein LOC127101741 [Lathyrus oleraceus]|uniref:uncharacterized protein LOC127101741 n=1 Tax=Pisum sativum TaxID=3888 RepID=UPI0021CF610F|nr:uncharacterized protein LOC127101741 [Pisum sativum]